MGETIQRIITTRKRINVLLNELSKSGVQFDDDLVNSTELQLESILKRDQDTMRCLTRLAGKSTK